jgi:lipopolysaccharide transport system permease protein
MNINDETKEWSTVIKPKGRLLDIDLKAVWRYRDLWYMFVKRDIVTSYKQTILGPLWFIIQPTITTIMFMIVFGGIAHISTDGLPQPLFYLAGISLWNYFSECLNRTSSTFTNNAGIFGKVYFPRLVVPLSTITSSFIRLAIQLGLFIAVYIVYVVKGANIHPNITLLLFPILLIIMAGLSLGFGILISSMTTKYRDLTLLFGFVVQLWMYATPVIYPLSMMSPHRQWIMALNPLTSIIEIFKYSTLGVGVFSWGMLAYSFAFMLVILALGIIVFNKVERSFMDTV